MDDIVIPELDRDLYKEFIVGRELGKGHFACVKLVTNRKDRTKYACKIIQKKFVGKSNREAVMKEIKILEEVGHHTSCVNMMDFFVDDSHYYIVMEYCGGGDLFSKIIEDGAFSEETAADYMRQLASGIQHIHKQGVAHRDIKPENILLTESGQLKLADFGLSKMVDRKALMKTQCGTWAYCAPEVLMKKPYTLAVDVWSLGVLMYILLCGYHPFDECGDAAEHALQRRVIKVDYNFVDPNWDKVSMPAKDVIASILMFDPNKRLTIESFLDCAWFKGQLSSQHLNHVNGGLSKLGKSKLKRAVKKTIAMNTIRGSTKSSSSTGA